MGSADISRRTAYLWLAAAVAAGALLRWWTIGQEALWADEALSAIIAHYSATALWLEPIDPTGPVYYLVHAAMVPVGATETIARLPSLLAGLVTIVATYGLGRTLSSRFVGTLAATLVAVSAPMIEYSQEARGYAVLVALITTSAWMLASLFQPHRTRVRYAFGAGYLMATIAAASTHLVGFLWAASSVAGVILAVRRHDNHLSRREAVAIILIGAVLMVPEFRRLSLFAFGNNNFTWLAPASLADRGRLMAWQWLPFAHRNMAIAAVAAVLVAITALYAGRRPAAEWASERRFQIVVPALLIGQPLLVWLVGALVTPILMYRTIIPAVPAAAIVIALVISWQTGTKRLAFAAVAVSLWLMSAVDQGLVQPKAPWGQAARRAAQAQVALVCPSWQSAAFLARGSNRNTLAWLNGQPRVATLDSDPPGLGWEQAYFDRIHASKMSESDPGLPVPTDLRSVAIVLAGCSAEERAQIGEWLKSQSLRPDGATTFRPEGRTSIELENGETTIRVERWISSPPPQAPQA